MKKTILPFLIVLSLNLAAQPFLGIEYGTKGVGLNLGHTTATGAELKAGFNVPLINAEVPNVFYAAIGQQFNFQQGNWSLTPSAGFALVTVQDFTQYNQGGGIQRLKFYKPKFGLDFGRNQHIGRLYISANYVGYLYFNIGIRGYLK